MAQITLHDSAKRPWGIETLVTVEEDGEVYNFSICTKAKPIKENLEIEAVALMNKQKQIILEKDIQANDIHTLEIQKQTLITEIEDLKAQKTALIAEVK